MLSLIGILLALGAMPVQAEDTADWPDAIDYPPNPVYQNFPALQGQTQPSQAEQFTAGQANTAPPAAKTTSKAAQEPNQKPGGVKGFFARRKEAKTPGPTEEQITQVGPREYASRPDPLLRLPVKIRTAEGLLLPGIYMVRQKSATDGMRELALTRQNKVMGIIVVHAAELAPLTPSPITQNPAKPQPVSIEAMASPDLSSITVILKEGGKRYESDPYPAIIDQRPVINY